MQNQSNMLLADFAGIDSNKNPFNAEGLAKWSQILVDDTQKAMAENDNYTVSPALENPKKEWRMALQDYNMAGQFSGFGAKDYMNGDGNSASTNFQKATTFIGSASAHVNLTVWEIQNLHK
jgi:hypothetical protein